MALMQCPECNRDVSDQATTCPQCAYPLTAPTAPQAPTPIRRRSRLPVLLLIVFVLSIIALSQKKPEPPLQASSSAYSLPAPAPLVVPPHGDWSNDLALKTNSWTRNDFGVATWNVTIRNVSSKWTYKDIHFKTIYWAPSGTKIDESLLGHTEFIKIPPNKTVKISFTEFAHTQAENAHIEIDSAVSQ